MLTEDNEQPLGLPQGSVRAILTLMLVGACIAAAFLNKDAFSVLSPLAGAGIGYYFSKRAKED
jgi:hypothetical protein